MALSNTHHRERTLEGVTLFSKLEPNTRSRVEKSCTWRSYASGEPILNHLDASDDVFFITRGGARIISYSPTGKIVSFRDIGPGDTFGEIPAIDGGPRSASVEASTECVVGVMSAAAFRDLLRNEPFVAEALLRQQVGTIRRLSTRVEEFSSAIMGITGRKIYGEVQGIRAMDVYPGEEVKAALVDKTFPKSAEDMTLKLSNVTAAFYGLMLKHVGQRFGWNEIDGLSRNVFRELGRLKTREALESGIDLPRDARGLIVVFITAVHSASPEYNFHVLEYAPNISVVRIFGISRYDRIAKTLDIEEHLTWPELVPFFEGIAEELGIKCAISTDLKDLGEAGRYDCIYRCTSLAA